MRSVPPFVLEGDNLAAMSLGTARSSTSGPRKWVSYWTDGKGNFVTSAMEDTGTYQSLTYPHPTGKVNKERVMVLRTASNLHTLPPGMLWLAEHLLRENEGYAGLNCLGGGRLSRGLAGRRWRSSRTGRSLSRPLAGRRPPGRSPTLTWRCGDFDSSRS